MVIAVRRELALTGNVYVSRFGRLAHATSRKTGFRRRHKFEVRVKNASGFLFSLPRQIALVFPDIVVEIVVDGVANMDSTFLDFGKIRLVGLAAVNALAPPPRLANLDAPQTTTECLAGLGRFKAGARAVPNCVYAVRQLGLELAFSVNSAFFQGRAGIFGLTHFFAALVEGLIIRSIPNRFPGKRHGGRLADKDIIPAHAGTGHLPELIRRVVIRPITVEVISNPGRGVVVAYAGDGCERAAINQQLVADVGKARGHDPVYALAQVAGFTEYRPAVTATRPETLLTAAVRVHADPEIKF